MGSGDNRQSNCCLCPSTSSRHYLFIPSLFPQETGKLGKSPPPLFPQEMGEARRGQPSRGWRPLGSGDNRQSNCCLCPSTSSRHHLFIPSLFPQEMGEARRGLRSGGGLGWEGAEVASRPTPLPSLPRKPPSSAGYPPRSYRCCAGTPSCG